MCPQATVRGFGSGPGTTAPTSNGLGDSPGGSPPSTFRWSSSGALAGPRPAGQHSAALAVKDFSVVRHNNQWLIYATTAARPAGGLVRYAFGDWPRAAAAYQGMDPNAGGEYIRLSWRMGLLTRTDSTC